MKVHTLFPITVCEYEYPKHEKFKQIFFKNGLKHFNKDGFSEESTGHVTLHHEESYKDLYEFTSYAVKQYLEVLSVNHTLFDVNLVKSWLNVIENRPTPMHAHRDAHISISYYVNTPEESNQAIRFYNYDPRMEPFAGCILYNNTSNNWNELNSYSWQFTPKQGSLFVFPSYIMHDTVCDNPGKENGVTNNEDLKRKRICIASDVVLTYKEKQAKTLGLQPIKNWRQF
jgi:uncharacterized protein (TIGR02466 family)